MSFNNDNDNNPRRHSVLGVFLRGCFMGVADLIPGVSGGTIAFITGIYARLLSAVAYFSQPAFFKLLLSLARPSQFKAAVRALWSECDGLFLAALFGGILAAILLTSRLLHYLLLEQTEFLLSFFFGLVLASIAILYRKLKHTQGGGQWQHIVLFVIAAMVTLWVVTRPPLALEAGSETSLLFIFFGAVIAISAMLLPGISGSYLLLIMGLYGEVITALHERDFVIIIVFASGCGIGILLFARLLAMLLQRFAAATTYAILGIMVGALPKLYPLKEEAEGMKVILQANVLPDAWLGAQVAGLLVFCLLGMLAMFAIEWITNRQQSNKQNAQE